MDLYSLKTISEKDSHKCKDKAAVSFEELLDYTCIILGSLTDRDEETYIGCLHFYDQVLGS